MEQFLTNFNDFMSFVPVQLFGLSPDVSAMLKLLIVVLFAFWALRSIFGRSRSEKPCRWHKLRGGDKKLARWQCKECHAVAMSTGKRVPVTCEAYLQARIL